MPEGIEKLKIIEREMKKGGRPQLKRCDLLKAIKEYEDLETMYDDLEYKLKSIISTVKVKASLTEERNTPIQPVL